MVEARFHLIVASGLCGGTLPTYLLNITIFVINKSIQMPAFFLMKNSDCDITICDAFGACKIQYFLIQRQKKDMMFLNNY